MTSPSMLVVDDEDVITFAFQSFFEQQGFDVHTEASAQTAERRLIAREYDVVVADLRLTGTGGTEGLAVIRTTRARSEKTVIVLLTAYRAADTETRAFEAGADIVLQKPTPLREVARTIQTLMTARAESAR